MFFLVFRFYTVLCNNTYDIDFVLQRYNTATASLIGFESVYQIIFKFSYMRLTKCRKQP